MEEDGSAFERRVLADGQITRAEYDQAAEHTVACIQDAFDEVVDGAVASAIETPSEIGFRYGFQVAYPPAISSDDLPWSEGTDETADDSAGHQTAQPLTDAMIQDPMERCPQEHFHRVSQIWQAQQIARQDF